MTLKTELIVLCGLPLGGLATSVLLSWLLTDTVQKGVTLAKDESAVQAGYIRGFAESTLRLHLFGPT